ncbi:hypothetical protein [Sedimentitalea arenosa]|uniref:Lipoprotein n=1 Tax=Sedimentitalea arenosa TaxID=2798803 RepID=A0A8J7LVC6_9RHOB|nr:hypothetical protein [Arenibacterium arenosum]MBJ6370701.1 hypothetical protein [Arenibacterium arenosum]
MIGTRIKRSILALALGLSSLGLAACDPDGVGVSGGVGVYYDSMLWNDYYYGGPRPPYYRPPPNRPVPPARPPVGVTPPIGTVPPGFRPPTARPPVTRPPVARPPIHRPAGGGGRFR